MRNTKATYSGAETTVSGPRKRQGYFIMATVKKTVKIDFTNATMTNTHQNCFCQDCQQITRPMSFLTVVDSTTGKSFIADYPSNPSDSVLPETLPLLSSIPSIEKRRAPSPILLPSFPKKTPQTEKQTFLSYLWALLTGTLEIRVLFVSPR